MEIAVVIIFVLGYLAITLEHSIKVDKVVPALIMAALCWAAIALGHLDVFEIHNGLVNMGHEFMQNHGFVSDQKELGFSLDQIKENAKKEAISTSLLHHLGKTAEILVFLMGAMTIVEIIDMHKGFGLFKKYITTKSKVKLLWIVSILAFILSAIIDNLTATIVLITILRKIVKQPEERLWYAGMIVVAANAGGAWSPIGDVTTTMLWIANKVTVLKLIEFVFIPSVVCLLVPLLLVSRKKVFKGEITFDENEKEETYKSSSLMLYLGLTMIVFVPIFKTVTHLPPYLGMALSLGVVWLVAEFVKPVENYDEETKHKFSVHKALAKIEMSSILFFLGILLGVAALESLGHLYHFANFLNTSLPNAAHPGEPSEIVIMLLGVGSAIIDNVPLVAASIGMFQSQIDHETWHFIAFAAGTGGSMLIIGSAAGVAAMGMERISFGWYLKNISWLALVGFLSGCAMFILFREVGFYG